MANTARLASRRFDTISLIKILLCFYLTIAAPYSYALNGNPLNFTNVSNFAKNSGGAVANFFFKDYAGTTYSSKNHIVTNKQMGSVWRNRWAGLNPFTGGVVAIAALLAAADWILDPANNTIRKRQEGSEFLFTFTLLAPVSLPGVDRTCLGNTTAEVSSCFTQKVNNYYSGTGKHAFITFYALNPPIPLDQLLPGVSTTQSNYAKVVVKYDGSTNTLATHYSHLTIKNEGETEEHFIHISEAELADIVSQADPATLQELATSPDYIAESHAPTIAAAAAAEPETTTTPEPQKATLGTKKETVTTTNPDGTTTTTTTTTQTNPDGSPALNPDGTPKTPHVQTTTTNPDGSTTTTTNAPKPAETETPAFCDWAKTLCTWLDWTKVDPVSVNPAQTKVDIQDRDVDDIGLPIDIDTTRISWGQNCPSPISADFSLMGQSIALAYKFDVVCDFAAKFRPYVIGLSYLTGAYIVMGLNRTRSE